MKYACGNEPMIGDTVEVVDDAYRYGLEPFKKGDRLTVSEVIPNNQGTPKTVEYLVRFLQYPTDTSRDCDRFRLVSRATPETPKQEATKSLGQICFETVYHDRQLGSQWSSVGMFKDDWEKAAQAVVDAYRSRESWVTKEYHTQELNKLAKADAEAYNLLLQVKDQLERKLEALSSPQKETESLRVIELLQDRESYRTSHAGYVAVTERLINELNRKIITLTKEGA